MKVITKCLGTVVICGLVLLGAYMVGDDSNMEFYPELLDNDNTVKFCAPIHITLLSVRYACEGYTNTKNPEGICIALDTQGVEISKPSIHDVSLYVTQDGEGIEIVDPYKFSYYTDGVSEYVCISSKHYIDALNEDTDLIYYLFDVNINK